MAWAVQSYIAEQPRRSGPFWVARVVVTDGRHQALLELKFKEEPSRATAEVEAARICVLWTQEESRTYPPEARRFLKEIRAILTSDGTKAARFDRLVDYLKDMVDDG